MTSNVWPVVIIDANSAYWSQAPQKMSQIWIRPAFCPGYTQCKTNEGLLMYIAAENSKIWNQYFKRMHNNRNVKFSNATKIIPK